MKGVYVIILGIGSFFTSIYNISQLNTVGEAASLSFAAENYTATVVLYHQLIDSMDYPHSEAKLNLAHSYYRAGDTTVNVQLYNQITIEDTNRTIRSLAHQQLGAIRYDKQDIEKALEKYKHALKADPYNEEARFNYELLKKRQQDPNQQQKDQQKKDKEQNKDQQDQKDKQQGDQKDQQDQQKGDQQKDGEKDKKGEGKKDQQNQQNGEKDKEKGDKGEQEQQQNGDKQKGEKKDGDKGEGDKKDEQKKDGKEGQKPGEKQDKKGEKDGEALSPEEQKRQEEAADRAARAERFEKSGMNEKTAEMLLNASRQREKQYLQQLKKRPSKSPDSDKPDW